MRLILIFTLFSCLSVQAQQDAARLRETAETFRRQGDYSNALLVLNRALQQKPDDLDIQTDIAYIHYLQRDMDNALSTIKPLLAREDAEVRTFQVGGNIYKALEDLKECDRMYRKALKKFPKSGALHSEFGELLWARQEPDEAIAEWEQGIVTDPSYPGNYYHAAKFYYAVANNVWSLVYGELFLNLESYSTRTVEIKILLVETYKKFFSGQEGIRDYKAKPKTAFEEAFREVLNRQSPMATNGITAESLTMIRTRFILEWFEGPAKKFPHRLLEQQQYLIREGMFESYNQWLFGATTNILEYQNWLAGHKAEYDKFTYYQRNRVFRMPPGQYYGYPH
jgi:tetratricopeptide (TPR) repeat protein